MKIIYIILSIVIGFQGIKSATIKGFANTTGTVANFTSPTNATVINKCFKNEAWDPEIYNTHKLCLTHKCTNDTFNVLDFYITCNDYKRPQEPQLIGSFVSKYALLRAAQIAREYTDSKEHGQHESYEKDHFYVNYGYLRRSYQPLSQPLQFQFKTNTESVKFPSSELLEGISQYQFAVFWNIYKLDSVRYALEDTPLKVSVEKITASEKKQPVTLQLNSKIISFSVTPQKDEEKYGDFIEVTFQYRDYANTLNHKCIRMAGTLGGGWWTNAGCHEYATGRYTIVCRCREIVGSFAVLSELVAQKDPPAILKRDTITTILEILCYVGIASSVSCILLPYALRCSHLGGMLKIYFWCDITLAVECMVLLLGVSKSEDIQASRFIAIILHFLQHSIMLWAISEGVHIYHGITPLFTEATGMIFFYTTLVYGSSAALTGAASGYNFQFTGKTQYIWPMASGFDMFYIILPTVMILLFFGAFFAFMMYEILGWIGTKTDYLYERCWLFVRRSMGWIIILAITHMFGVFSMSGGGSGFYAYLFMAFFAIQIIMMFYFHFFSNFEIWEWKSQQNLEKQLILAQKKKLQMLDDSDSDDSVIEDTSFSKATPNHEPPISDKQEQNESSTSLLSSVIEIQKDDTDNVSDEVGLDTSISTARSASEQTKETNDSSRESITKSRISHSSVSPLLSNSESNSQLIIPDSASIEIQDASRESTTKSRTDSSRESISKSRISNRSVSPLLSNSESNSQLIRPDSASIEIQDALRESTTKSRTDSSRESISKSRISNRSVSPLLSNSASNSQIIRPDSASTETKDASRESTTKSRTDSSRESISKSRISNSSEAPLLSNSESNSQIIRPDSASTDQYKMQVTKRIREISRIRSRVLRP